MFDIKRLILSIIIILSFPLFIFSEVRNEPLRESSEVFSVGEYGKINISDLKNIDDIINFEENVSIVNRDYKIIKSYIAVFGNNNYTKKRLGHKLFVMNPVNNKVEKSIKLENKANWVVSKGKFLYIGFKKRFGIYSIKKLPNISLVKIWKIKKAKFSKISEIVGAIKGDYLFVGYKAGNNDEYLRIKIYNIKNPYKVFLVSKYKKKHASFYYSTITSAWTNYGAFMIINRMQKIGIAGDFIFIPSFLSTSNYPNFLVLDVSDINNVKKVAEYELDEGLKDFQIKGNYLYCLLDNKFVILDISNPAKIKKEGTYNISGADFEIKGRYSFIIQNVLADKGLLCEGFDIYDHFLHVLDVSDVNNISLIDSVEVPSLTYGTLNVLFSEISILNNSLYLNGYFEAIAGSNCYYQQLQFFESGKFSLMLN